MSELNLLSGRIKELEELVEELEGTAIFNQNCWGRERAVMIDNLQISRSENESLRELLKQANVHVPCNWPLRGLINATLISSPENPS